MKKIALRILTLVLASMMVVSMAACSGDNNSSASSAAVSTSSEASSEASSTASAGVSTQKFATIEEFVNSDIMQSQIETMKSSLEDSGMNITMTGEGNKLIYSYTFDAGTDTEGLAELLESGMEEQASVFENVAASVKLAVEVESPIVVVRYLDSEGNEIYSREFTEAE